LEKNFATNVKKKFIKKCTIANSVKSAFKIKIIIVCFFRSVWEDTFKENAFVFSCYSPPFLV